MENLINLEEQELKSLKGGTFAWDVGWFLGHALTGQFLTPAGTALALSKYDVHYEYGA